MFKNIVRSVLFAAFLFILSPALWAATDREAAMDLRMHCLQMQMDHSTEIGWQDVCYMASNESSSGFDSFSGQSENLKREKMITDELDGWEQSAHPSKQRMMMARNEKIEEPAQEIVLPPMKVIAKPIEPRPIKQTKKDDDDFDSDAALRENVDHKKIRKHLFSLGAEYFYAKYEEPGLISQDGMMYGFNGLYQYRPSSGQFLHNPIANVMGIEGMYAKGNLDYSSPSQNNIQVDKRNYMFEIRGILGQEFVHEDYTLMLYSGFGYRYLNDDDNGELHSGFYGYEREESYYYLPVGFETNHDFNNENSIALKGEFDLFLAGNQFSHASDGNKYLDPLAHPNDDLSFDQKHGYGVRGSIAFSHQTEFIGIVFEPFVRYWHIEDSDIVYGYVDGSYDPYIEPENKTTEAGIKLAVQF